MYIKVKKVKGDYRSSQESISELRSVICYIGSHSVAAEHACLKLSQVLTFPTPERRKAELTRVNSYIQR